MKMTIERGKRKYIVHLGRECGARCSFAKVTPEGYCDDGCHLPKWFENIVSGIATGALTPHLEEVSR